MIVEIAEFPDAGTYRGYDEMQRRIQGWLDAFDEIPVGDHVVVTILQHVRKLTHASGYRDRSNALVAAGLPE